MNDYFTFFYVKHFELPLCMKCAIQINLPCLKGKKIHLPQQLDIDEKEIKPHVPRRVQVECRGWNDVLVCARSRRGHHCKARLDRPNDGSRSAGEGLLRITVFPFSRHNKIKWNTFSYIFYLVISSDSINEKVLMISVHH